MTALRRSRRPASWPAALLASLLAGACGGGGGGPSTPDDLAERASGGETTVYTTSDDAFGFPLANLSAERSDAFFVGNSVFRSNWVTAPSSTQGRDGLGPLFNAVGCSACHLRDGRSPPQDPDGSVAVGLLLRLARPATGPQEPPRPDPSYGPQFQPASILGIPPEGEVVLAWWEEPGAYPDGTPYALRRPVVAVADLAYGPLDGETSLEPRIAPSVFGLGLLAALDEATVRSREDPEDRDGDGISGRAQRVVDLRTGNLRLGRFGWKAGQPTLEQQSAAAFLQDVGLTSSLFPFEGCTDAQVECAAAPSGGVPEVEEELLAALTFYMHTLAVPGRRAPQDATVRRGELLFRDVGCAACHVPTLQTGSFEGFPELSDQRIHPYTDLLLHDLGPGLEGGATEGLATTSEWRTPPLWGLGLQAAVSGHTFLLHDGRARTVEEAILWHGGEAQPSRSRFEDLPAADRAALLRFLEDL